MDKSYDNFIRGSTDNRHGSYDNSTHEDSKEIESGNPYCELDDIKVTGRERTWNFTNNAYEKLGERKGPSTGYLVDPCAQAARPESPPPYRSSKVAADPDSPQSAKRSTRCVLFVIGIISLVLSALAIGVVVGIVFNESDSDPTPDPPTIVTSTPTQLPTHTSSTIQTDKSTPLATTQSTTAPSSTLPFTTTPAPIATTSPNIPTVPPSVGQWAEWSVWSSCDVVCGPGTHTRNRTCFLDPCVGVAKQLESCFEKECPSPAETHGKWTTWGPWNSCEQTCGESVQTRNRVCKKDNGKDDCIGKSAHTRGCNAGECVDCTMLECDNNFKCLKCVCLGNTYTGKVLTESGVPIQYVKVSYTEFGHTPISFTGTNGEFSLSNICPGDSITFSKEGYADKTINDTTSIVRLSRIQHLYISKEPIGSSAIVGGCILLTCEAKGVPGSDYYEWYHDERWIEYENGNSLKLSNISKSNAGQYKCRANNDYTAVFSRTVSITVEGFESEICDAIPRSRLVRLPVGCFINGLEHIDVGLCSPMPCALEHKETCETTQTLSKCGVIRYEEQAVQCTGFMIPVEVVAECGCISNAQTRKLRGTVVDKHTYNPVFGAAVTINHDLDMSTTFTGQFEYDIPIDVTRITVDVSHNSYSLLSSVITIDGEDVEYVDTFYLKDKPEATVFSCNEGADLGIASSDDAETLAKIEVPPNAFFDSDGNQYDGEVKAFVDYYDAREPDTMIDAPSDFTAINDEGEAEYLESAGMFRLDFTDAAGNILNVGSNISITFDINSTDANIADDMKLWSLDSRGRWQFVSNFSVDDTTSSRRKRQIDDNTFGTRLSTDLPDVGREWYNFDKISRYMCYSKVKIYKEDILTDLYDGTGYQNKFVKVQIVTLAGQGSTINTVSQVRSYSDYNTNGFNTQCIAHPCDTYRNDDVTNYQGYIIARDYQNKYFNPVLNNDFKNEYDFEIEDEKIKTRFVYEQEKLQGPFYDYQRGWSYSPSCVHAPAKHRSFQFYRDEHTCDSIRYPTDDQEVLIKNSRLFFYSSEYANGLYKVVYMRVKVTTDFDKVVLTGRSYTQDSSTPPDNDITNFYGLRQECVKNSSYACIEVKTPGNVFYGSGGQEMNEKTRVIVHMQGTYDINTVEINPLFTRDNTQHNVSVDTNNHADVMLNFGTQENFHGRFYKTRQDIVTARHDTEEECKRNNDDTYWVLHFTK